MKSKLRLIYLALLIATSAQSQQVFSANKVLKLMGCRFEITTVAESDSIAWTALEAGVAEISRIEKIISSWDPTSQTSAINFQAGISAVEVSEELYDLIYRSKKIAQLSDGAFDISFASMDRIWTFDKEEHSLPDEDVVNSARENIDYNKIILNPENHSVFLEKKGMKIGFGAIGKGFAANKAKALMESIPGVIGGVVNASGDLIAWGKNQESEYWNIQIANPKNKTKSLGNIELKNRAIVTSGDYEKYFTSQGIRYAHIIDPRTGYPTNGLKSVTVIRPDAELADALATTVFVLGLEDGIFLINKLNDVECIIVSEDNSLHYSNHLQINLYE